jgi:NADH dehydrogenase
MGLGFSEERAMSTEDIHVVTGAFGYSGKYIATRLLNEGLTVHTLTNSLRRPNPFGAQVKASPFNFAHSSMLVASLKGARVLYNTYWVRFNYTAFRHEEAVQNTLTLFRAAKEAGVERIVHVSITNPSIDSKLEYFNGKAQLEIALKNLGVAYSILRPTVLFGKEDILVNNIAWALRHFPMFGVFGDGEYRLQPIYVDDLAALAVQEGKSSANTTIDAIGPETFAYRDLVRKISEIIGVHRPIVSVPPSIGYLIGAAIGRVVGDVMITREEIQGLMQGLLCTNSPPGGSTRLTDWAKTHAEQLGKRYASELARRKDREHGYDEL